MMLHRSLVRSISCASKMTRWLVAVMLVLASMLSANVQAQPASSTPNMHDAVDLPQGFDRAASSHTLLGDVYAQDMAAIRAHAWDVWAGLSAPSGSATSDGQMLPVWETWFSATEVFDDRYARDTEPTAHRPVRHDLEIPLQSQHHVVPGRSAAVMSFVKFNPPAAQFIWDERLYLRQTLNGLQGRFDAVDAPVEERQIKPFPRDAVVLKVVFWLIKSADSRQSQDGLTALPYWDPDDPPPPDGQTPTHLTWSHCVAVDPTNRRSGSTASITCNGRPAMASVVNLDDFYHYRLGTPEDVAQARKFMAILSGVGHEQERFVTNEQQVPELDDHIALVAMHVTTKEIENWTFQTFWWSPSPDLPPFGDDRPDRVVGPWRHYAMCAAYSMVTPRLPDLSPHRCFNPFLETDLGPTASYQIAGQTYPPDPMAGTRSNCMNCHMRAAWGSTPPANPANTGFIPPNDPSLAGKVKTDFMWSLLFHSQPPGG